MSVADGRLVEIGEFDSFPEKIDPLGIILQQRNPFIVPDAQFPELFEVVETGRGRKPVSLVQQVAVLLGHGQLEESFVMPRVIQPDPLVSMRLKDQGL